jgi:hypothetical protein
LSKLILWLFGIFLISFIGAFGTLVVAPAFKHAPELSLLAAQAEASEALREIGVEPSAARTDSLGASLALQILALKNSGADGHG